MMLAVDAPSYSHNLFVFVSCNFSFQFLIVFAFVTKANRVTALRFIFLAVLFFSWLLNLTDVITLRVTYI